MDMVRHDTPCKEAIAFAVEFQEGLLHDLRHAGMPERTTAVAVVEIPFDTNASRAFPSRSGNTGELAFDLPAFFSRKGIRQPESDRLREIQFVVVREMSTPIPAEKGRVLR